ncbi:TetR family transcriptional regulator [Caulobacter sp. SLTY]|uniref:TetR family transcriptional regulator n=1 Tax=Caulobacter sp. SLTY TaxID=2683262 RepID=UPI00141343F2|nr:TetR family transcriptional regulator [Caulobacter sp. SLTY]
MTNKPRPASPDAAGIRGRALDAAAAILAEQGAEALNLRAIAETAGIGLASIYHYFENKEALLVSLALMGLEDLRRDILDYQARPEFASPMRGGARAFFHFVETRPELFSLMLGERLLSRHSELREAEYRMFEAYKAAVLADDRIPAHRRENAAHALWALGRGMAAIMASYPAGQRPPEIMAQLAAGAGWLIDRPD